MIGDTAGRTSRNPTSPDAVARSTDRQRRYEVPPPGAEWVIVTTREKARREIRSSLIWCGFLVADGIVLLVVFHNHWMAYLSILFFVLAVALAGVSRPWQRIRQDLTTEEIPEAQRGSQRAS